MIDSPEWEVPLQPRFLPPIMGAFARTKGEKPDRREGGERPMSRKKIALIIRSISRVLLVLSAAVLFQCTGSGYYVSPGLDDYYYGPGYYGGDLDDWGDFDDYGDDFDDDFGGDEDEGEGDEDRD
jgi:hypothetical protein